MARQFVAIALVLFAIIGFACAAAPATPAAEPPKASANATDAAAAAPGADNEVGNTDGAAAAPGAAAVVEGPISGPGAAAGGELTPAESPKSGASPVKISAAAGVAAIAAGVFFY